VFQKSAANSPVSKMDLSQASRHNSPSNCSALSASERDLVKKYNLNPSSVNITRLSHKVINSYKTKEKRNISDQQMINNDSIIAIKSEPGVTKSSDANKSERDILNCDVKLERDVKPDLSELNIHEVRAALICSLSSWQNNAARNRNKTGNVECSDVEESQDSANYISSGE
jgi:hypothetical protein